MRVPVDLFLSIPCVFARITVYSQQPFMGTATGTANVVAYTDAAAYDSTMLDPPPVSEVATAFSVQLDNFVVSGASIPQGGHFFGFSIEFSVINQVLGLNGSVLQVPFLNLMSSLQARGGSVRVRIGGNSQDTATLVPSLPNGVMMQKGTPPLESDSMVMSSPPLFYTPEVLYMLANISSLVDVHWYLGIPMNDTQHLRLGIVSAAEAILGDRLLGFQVGNEPDQYGLNHLRPLAYNASDYVDDFELIDMTLKGHYGFARKKLIGPSISSHWKLEDVWDAGFLEKFNLSLAALSAEYYHSNNCPQPVKINPQDVFASYLNHTAATSAVQRYLNSTDIAQRLGLPFIMLETNSASCGGLPGVATRSVARYGLLIMDYNSHIAILPAQCGISVGSAHTTMHLPVCDPLQLMCSLMAPAPPTNQSMFKSWSVGPIFYAALVGAEIFGKSNQSQIMDLEMNNGSIYTPGYAIYEAGVLKRLAIFNFISDPSGAGDYTATISLTEKANLTHVNVKYLVAPSVSSLKNITWAGQSFGPNLSSDGRLHGILDVKLIPCDPLTKMCQVQVPAPGFALVLLEDDGPGKTDAKTFATTVHTKTLTALTADAGVLATSNGGKGMQEALGSTGRRRKWWSLHNPRPDGHAQEHHHHINGARVLDPRSTILTVVGLWIGLALLWSDLTEL